MLTTELAHQLIDSYKEQFKSYDVQVLSRILHALNSPLQSGASESLHQERKHLVELIERKFIEEKERLNHHTAIIVLSNLASSDKKFHSHRISLSKEFTDAIL